MFWRLVQAHLWGEINKRMAYRFPQPICRTSGFYWKLGAVCLHTASQCIGTCIFGFWLDILFWFGNQFFVKVPARLLVGRLKDSSELMKDQENIAVTHFPIFKTFTHRIIKPFNHKIKNLESIPHSDKMKSEHHLTVKKWRNISCFLAPGT